MSDLEVKDVLLDAVIAERDALLAALDLIRRSVGHQNWIERIADAAISGADVRNPDTRRAIALGRWTPTGATP